MKLRPLMCTWEVQFGLAASSQGKSAGSDHRLSHKRYYDLVCVVRRSNLGWPPAPHWVTISLERTRKCHEEVQRPPGETHAAACAAGEAP
jgi:hypothetical protein